MRENRTFGSERGKPRKGLIYLPKFVELSYRIKKPSGQDRTAYRIIMRRSGIMSLKRPAAGGEFRFAKFFFIEFFHISKKTLNYGKQFG